MAETWRSGSTSVAPTRPRTNSTSLNASSPHFASSRQRPHASFPRRRPHRADHVRGGGDRYDLRSKNWRTVAAFHRAPPCAVGTPASFWLWAIARSDSPRARCRGIRPRHLQAACRPGTGRDRPGSLSSAPAGSPRRGDGTEVHRRAEVSAAGVVAPSPRPVRRATDPARDLHRRPKLRQILFWFFGRILYVRRLRPDLPNPSSALAETAT